MGAPIRKFHSGFTLIELLVIVAILGILAAILLPVFARTGCGGRRYSCSSNLRQMALAVQQYRTDNSRFPRAGRSDGSGYGWTQHLSPYLRYPEVLLCPSVEIAKTLKHTKPATTYFYNRHLQGYTLAQVAHPATVILFGEGEKGLNSYSCLEIDFCLGGDPPQMALTRHVKSANYLFVDGTVRNVYPATLNEKGYRFPAR
jgi:prepilin-type N-terminal cleavage/methylation domain-containing protein/prepilin-type processing-associated H-X9-DG protein